MQRTCTWLVWTRAMEQCTPATKSASIPYDPAQRRSPRMAVSPNTSLPRRGPGAFAGPGPGIWKGADRRAAHVRSGSMRRGPRVSSQSAGASHAVWSIAGDKEDETRKIEEAISFSSCDSEGGSNGARGDARFSALYGPAAENAQAGGPPLLGLVVRAQQRQVHLCTTHWYHIKSTSMS